MFYVGQQGTMAPVVHLSPLGGMTLCGILAPYRDRFGRRWWADEWTTLSIADVFEAIADEKWDEYRRPCGNCMRIARTHPERLIERAA